MHNIELTVLNTKQLFNETLKNLQFQTNKFCNLRRAHFATSNKYILPCWTNTQKHFAILNKYTNAFVNIRQIHFAIAMRQIYLTLVWSGLTYHSHIWNTRQMVTQLFNMRNGQSPVSVRESVSQSVTMISARDASASEKISIPSLHWPSGTFVHSAKKCIH